MGQTHGEDLADPIDKRDFIPYDRGERQTTDEKNKHELKRSHLLAWTPPHDTNNQDQKEITEECSRDCSHASSEDVSH